MVIDSKLKETSGASIVLALLFFLLCAIAGSVVLAAGSASAGRMAKLKQQEQNYYTVSSAAKLFRDELEGKTLYVITDGEDYQIDPNANSTLTQSSLSGIVQEAVQSVREHPTDIYTKKLTITVKNQEEIKPVMAKFSMNNHYQITARFYEEDNQTSYACLLSLPAAIQNDDSNHSLHIVWMNSSIQKSE